MLRWTHMYRLGFLLVPATLAACSAHSARGGGGDPIDGGDAADARPSSDAASTTSASPVGIPGSWSLTFDDEFDGLALDPAKWNVGWFGAGVTQAVNGAEDTCYDPAEVSLDSGALHLGLQAKPLACGGTTQPFAASLIDSDGKYEFTFGAMEARMWLPGSGAIANWPAFWTDGQSWPTDGEIDVMEGLGSQACWHFHYAGGGPGDCVDGNFAGWHTFAADWEADAITLYYDGVQVGRQTDGVTSAPMYLVLEASHGTDGGATLAPSSVMVDYVRVWHH